MNIYLLLYICVYVLPTAHCLLLPVAYFPLPIAYCLLIAYARAMSRARAPHHVLGPLSSRAGAEAGTMRHGHEMLWFLRGSFSESELPLSYNAKVTDTRTQLIGYEINLLNKV